MNYESFRIVLNQGIIELSDNSSIDINDGDELIQSKISEWDQDIILATNKGKSIRFNETQINGIIRFPQKKGYFVPENNPNKGFWFKYY